MSDKPHYLGHRQRLKQRLLRGPDGLADYEIMELVLASVLPRRDTKPLAKELLARFGSLAGVLRADPGQLAEVRGVGEAVVAQLALLRELFARLMEQPVRGRRVLDDPGLVAEAARARFGADAVEQLWVALVDNKNRAIAWEELFRGTVDRLAVYPREVLTLALKHRAAGIILVHNHPGGDPTPSREDLDRTQEVAAAARQVGIRLLDHVVVAEQGYFSMRQRGYL